MSKKNEIAGGFAILRLRTVIIYTFKPFFGPASERQQTQERSVSCIYLQVHFVGRIYVCMYIYICVCVCCYCCYCCVAAVAHVVLFC